MTITIPDELDEFVRMKLRGGEFESPGAVVSAALAAWQGQEIYHAMDRAALEGLLLESDSASLFPKFALSKVQLKRAEPYVKGRLGIPSGMRAWSHFWMPPVFGAWRRV